MGAAVAPVAAAWRASFWRRSKVSRVHQEPAASVGAFDDLRAGQEVDPKAPVAPWARAFPRERRHRAGAELDAAGLAVHRVVREPLRAERTQGGLEAIRGRQVSAAVAAVLVRRAHRAAAMAARQTPDRHLLRSAHGQDLAAHALHLVSELEVRHVELAAAVAAGEQVDSSVHLVRGAATRAGGRPALISPCGTTPGAAYSRSSRGLRVRSAREQRFPVGAWCAKRSRTAVRAVSSLRERRIHRLASRRPRASCRGNSWLPGNGWRARPHPAIQPRGVHPTTVAAASAAEDEHTPRFFPHRLSDR